MAKSDVLVRMKADTQSYDASIAKARRTLEGFRQENLSLGGVIGQVTKSFTAYAAGIASISALAGKLSSVVSESVDLARAGEGVRQAFDRLNRPDLLDNLRQATHGTVNDLELMKQAVKFDNFNLSMDQMGTMLAFAQQQAKDTGQDVNFLVDSIVTGLGRKSLPILDNLGLSATEIRERMKETGDMTKAVAQIIEERMAAAGGYVETAADRAARATTDMQNAMMKLGETFGPITQNSDSLWNSIKIGAINALTYVGNLINYLHEAGRISKTIGNMNGGGMMERFGNNLRNSKDPSSLYQRQLAEINRSINSAEAKLQQAEKGGMGSIQIYRERVQALKEIKKQYQELYQTISRPAKAVITEPITTKTPKGGGSKSDITYAADSIAAQEKLVQDLNKAWREAGSGVRDSYLPQIVAAEEKLNIMKNEQALLKEQAAGKLKGGEVQTTGISDNFSGSFKNMKIGGLDPKILPKITGDVKNMSEEWQKAGSAISAVGSAMAGIEDPAAKVMGTIAQAIATIALTYAQSLKGTFTPWDWIAGAASGLATMISVISAIHSATGYASGGVISGNTYSNDQIPIMANAGELILNKSQQNNIASQLTQAGGGGRLVAKLRGRDILISLERELSETGKGQLATWR